MRNFVRLIAFLALIALAVLPHPGGRAKDINPGEVDTETPPIAPAKSIGSGLLLEPPLDLEWFTREKFIEATSTVGKEKIGKKWTSAIKQLPPPKRPDAHGLTEAEIREYMLTAKQLFDRGEAIPM